MALDAIQKVTETEKASKERLNEAGKAAKKILSDMQAERRAFFEKRMAETAEKIKACMRAAEQKAEKNAQEIKAQASEACEKQKEAAKQKMPQAVQFIVERIVNG